MSDERSVITVSLNPAIDRVLEVAGFTIGAHQKGRQLARTPAGKAVNVSRALAVLGVPSIATGFVGRHELEQFEQQLDAMGAQSQLLAVDGTTRENITIVDPVAKQETHIRDVGFELTGQDLDRLAHKLDLIVRPATVVIFSGSVPPGMTPAQFAELVQHCIDKQAHVAVDTSGEPLRLVAGKRLWLAKPNLNELAEMLDRPIQGDEQIIDAGRQLSKHIRCLIVSCGSAGGYVFTGGSALLGQVTVEPERIKSTVGCGDCLLAGFVAAQLRGHDVRTAYRYGLAVATAAAVSLTPGEFSLEDVDEFFERASVEPLDA